MPLALKQTSKFFQKNDIIHYIQNELWNVISTDQDNTTAKSIIIDDASGLLEMDESSLSKEMYDSQKLVTVLQYEQNREMISYELPEQVIKKNPQVFLKTRPVDDNAIESLSYVSRFSIDWLSTHKQNAVTTIVEIFKNMSNAAFNEIITSSTNLRLVDEFETKQPLAYTYVKKYAISHTLDVHSVALMSHVNTIITLYKLLV